MAAEDIVRRARALVGLRFRPQGRSLDTGLDCIGVAAAALGLDNARCDYRLRGGSLEELERELAAAGLDRVDEASAGDAIAFRPGPEQLHLAIWTGSGIIHADAGLRRVVERPGRPPWPVLGIWRMEG